MRKAPFAVLLLIFAVLSGTSCGSAPAIVAEVQEDVPPDEVDMEPIELPPAGTLPVSSFGEVWAYVVAGREAALKQGLPLTDIGYFGAEIDSYGALTDVPARQKLSAFAGRVHLVVKCDGRALTHFAIAPGSVERKNLIADLIAAAASFDGLQIDFELVPQRDGAAFLSFLGELRAGLGKKMLTTALPARSRKLANDVYDYEKIAPLVDRILVMAYDEHWSTSVPGPVASLPWCKRVADYALSAIGREKLVMGIPFYGRAWGSSNPSRALLYTGVEDIIKENRITGIHRENGIPFFDYETAVRVKVFYDDDYSLAVRMGMYQAMGVAAVGFWRLGQETAAVWGLVQVEKP